MFILLYGNLIGFWIPQTPKENVYTFVAIFAAAASIVLHVARFLFFVPTAA